jgi:hypothetical protein
VKRAAVTLRAWLAGALAGVGLEGAFLLVGTGCLAVWAGYFGPAWPWAVVGVMSVLTAFALIVPRRSS